MLGNVCSDIWLVARRKYPIKTDIFMLLTITLFVQKCSNHAHVSKLCSFGLKNSLFSFKEKNTWKASWAFYVIWLKWKTSFCLFYTYIRLGSHKNYIFLDRLNTCNVFCQQLTRWLVLLLRDFLLGEGEGDCLECLCKCGFCYLKIK